ncbi:hypothetical protein EVAR_93300_1 [Eumeta japonica]|uniref:Uncharacterized protein n=1 Tax=Eumeta variegata TaxID=151549 RepID=A0A4C1USQ3_EUMVA|nr:hypothetical protein EVAR_93300_1 [Eumeta japonica]
MTSLQSEPRIVDSGKIKSGTGIGNEQRTRIETGSIIDAESERGARSKPRKSRSKLEPIRESSSGMESIKTMKESKSCKCSPTRVNNRHGWQKLDYLSDHQIRLQYVTSHWHYKFFSESTAASELCHSCKKIPTPKKVAKAAISIVDECAKWSAARAGAGRDIGWHFIVFNSL